MEIVSRGHPKAYDGVLYSVSQKVTEQQGEALRRSQKHNYRSMADRQSDKLNVVGSNPTSYYTKKQEPSPVVPQKRLNPGHESESGRYELARGLSLVYK